MQRDYLQQNSHCQNTKKLVFDFTDLSIDTIKEECLLSDDKDKNKVKQTNRKVGDINCDLLFDAYTPNNNKIR